jgi:hypothetical protein
MHWCFKWGQKKRRKYEGGGVGGGRIEERDDGMVCIYGIEHYF